MVTDGPVLLSPKQLLKNVARYLYLHNIYVLRQLPSDMKVRMKSATYFQSISGEFDGTRIEVEPWDVAPTGYTRPYPQPHSNDMEENPDATMTSEDKASHELRMQYLTTWANWSLAAGKFVGRGQALADAMNEGTPVPKKRKASSNCTWFVQVSRVGYLIH